LEERLDHSKEHFSEHLSDQKLVRCLFSTEKIKLGSLLLYDASRAVMAYSFCFEQNLAAILSVFKTTIMRRGIPKKLF
jgi:hypothetical protein